MRALHCQHCDSVVSRGVLTCPACGMPLSAKLGRQITQRFKIWFVIVVVFCVIMMLWLPPNWSWFLGN